MRYEGPNKGLEWTNLLLGIGLACAAFMFAELPAEAWNAGMVGTLIGCCSAAALPFRPSMNSSRQGCTRGGSRPLTSVLIILNFG
jgi:hypothetical protein